MGAGASLALGALLTMTRKLNAGDRHMLRLIARDAGADGWVNTSPPVYVMLKSVPSELIELYQTPTGGRVRLTAEGRNVVKAMAWL